MIKAGAAARTRVLVIGLLLVCRTASAQVADWTPVWPDRDQPPRRLAASFNPWIMPWRFMFSPGDGRNLSFTTHPPEFAPPDSVAPALSRSVWRVSEAAARNGDRDYLMVDKVHGWLIQFANGAPIFISRALTGASLADRLPPEALRKSYAEQWDLRDRVTPAGRFTVSHGFDRVVGPTLDINEIKGKDWSIAIHSAGSASREARLRSPLDQDRHITEGCVNVGADTMRRLVALPPRHGRIPLYILPMDESLITQLF